MVTVATIARGGGLRVFCTQDPNLISVALATFPLARAVTELLRFILTMGFCTGSPQSYD